MNGRTARKLRAAAGGQEIVTERVYFQRQGNDRTYRLQESTGRRKYQALKKVYNEMKGAA